jgi:bacitracin transport system ATP-binding protein
VSILELEDVTRCFGRTKVLDGLSLRVPGGKIYGFLGRNGAGKTTTIRIILGLIRMHGGVMRVDGRSLEVRGGGDLGRIGSIVEFPGFYPNLDGTDNLRVFQWLHGTGDGAAIPRVLDLVGLTTAAKKRVGAYSLGMKQRLGIARALLHDPDILMLDEPTNGLDPSGIREIRELLRSLSVDHGKTVFLSSHILSEIEQIVDMVGILKDGKMLEEIGIDELRRKCRRGVVIRAADRDPAMRFLRDAGVSCAAGKGEDDLQLAVGSDAAEVNAMLVRRGFRVSMLLESSQTLEDYFLEATA